MTEAVNHALCRQRRNLLLLNVVVYIATTRLEKISIAKRLLQFYRYFHLRLLYGLTIPPFHMK